MKRLWNLERIRRYLRYGTKRSDFVIKEPLVSQSHAVIAQMDIDIMVSDPLMLRARCFGQGMA